jgi:hypothetical protein
MSYSDFQTFARRRRKNCISDDRMRAITNYVFLKCGAMTDPRDDGALRKTKLL